MKIVAITQARVGSSRLPAKVLKPLGNQSMLELHLQRVLQSRRISQLVVATTTEPGSEKIAAIASEKGAAVFFGSLDDVLDRFYAAAKNLSPAYVVRLTSDCPLLDPQLLDDAIAFAVAQQVDYVSNTLSPTFPDGQDIEVFRFTALEQAWKEATLKSEREHVTPYIWKNSTFHQKNLFSSAHFAGREDYSHVRLTVDDQNDLDTVTAMVQELGTEAAWETYAQWYLAHSNRVRNKSTLRNEGYTKSLSQDI